MQWPVDAVQPGTRVCLKHNPARIGTVSNELDGSSSRLRALVMFQDGTEEFVLLASLEPVPHGAQKPYSLIKNGRYGRCQDLRAAITFHRLSGKLANLIYSLNTTNTIFMPHQFKPVLNFLDSPSGGILIADEVGLGKTIEAGLIWTELKARFDATRLLVICPAMLREKWKMELDNRFGVKADIIDARELAKRLKALSEKPYDSFALIASIQGLRPPRDPSSSKTGAAQLAQLLESVEVEEPLLDLIVIDEAHYLRNEETQTSKLGALLRPVSANMVLLSATPIQLRNRDLFNLLHLLDDDSFPFESSFEDILQANSYILKLRKLALSGNATEADFTLEIGTARSHSIFENSMQLRYLQKNPPSDKQLKDHKYCAELVEQLDRINPLSKVISRTLKREVTEMRVLRQPDQRIAQMAPVEREFYDRVTNVIFDYCEQEGIPTGFMLTIPQRQLSSCMAAACRRWQRKAAMSEKEIESFQNELMGVISVPTGEQPGPLLSQLMDLAREYGDYPELRRCDSKYALLVQDLRSYWINHPGIKVVLFAFYTDTLHYLGDRLREDGITPLVLHGGMDKQALIQQFESDKGIQILLSSEVAAEGVDLQFASVVINYDLPWNPMRIEQRIGRIDRIGQQAAKILIWNYMCAGTIDERIYGKLLVRLDLFTRALGDMEAILGQHVRDLTIALLTHRLTPEQEEARINQTAQALEHIARQQETLESEAAQLLAHGDYILNKVHAAKELGRYITGYDLQVYVQDFLHAKYPGSRLKRVDNVDPVFNCVLDSEARVKFADFLERSHLKGKTRLLSHRPLALEFENQFGIAQPLLERVTQEHPLIRWITVSRQSVDPENRPYPVSAVLISRHELPQYSVGDYVFVIYRWALSGAQENERLIYIAQKLDGLLLDENQSELLVNRAAVFDSDLPGAANVLDNQKASELFERCQGALEESFVNYRARMERENHDRLQLMITLLQKRKDRQTQIIRDKIANHRSSGQTTKIKLIPAEEGKIRRLHERIDQRISELRLRDTLRVSENFVAGGVIRVQ